MNQHNEVLHFNRADDKVPNRDVNFGEGQNTEQEVATLDYTQQNRQLKAAARYMAVIRNASWLPHVSMPRF